MDFTKLTKIKPFIKTRSICMENTTGEKGKAGMATEGTGKIPSGDLGQTYKISPCVFIKPNEEFTLCDIKGHGCVNHIWMTLDINLLLGLELCVYYEGSNKPSIKCPLGKFFCVGFDQRSRVNSLLVTVNPAFGLNSYWPMPFRKGIKITVRNSNPGDSVLYYQIDYEERHVKLDEAYLCTVYSESLPVKAKENHVLVPTIKGQGMFVGTFMTFETDFTTWWGEGEFKFFMDGDDKFPTICGTGTEDYFGGAWNFEVPKGHYQSFSTAYQGLIDVIPEDTIYVKGQKFSMYRWHISDPIRFNKDIRVEVQTIGWTEDWKLYRCLEANVTTLSYLYLKKPL